MGTVEFLRLIIVSQFIGFLIIMEFENCETPFATIFTYCAMTGLVLFVLLIIFKIVGIC